MDEKKKEWFQKEMIIYFTGLCIMLISYLCHFRMNPHLAILFYWGVYFSQLYFLKKLHKKELLLLISVIIFYFILNEFYVYIRLDILLAIYFAVLTIYYVGKEASEYPWQKIVSIALIIPCVMLINFYIHKDKLIKDRGLEKCIQETLTEYGYKGEITLSQLEKINRLSIRSKYQVHNLDGIENLKNLEKLYLHDAKIIKDFQPLTLLPKFKKLCLSDAKLSNLLEAGKFISLEELELNYCEMNGFLSEKNFPNLKRLEVQGVEWNDLLSIKELKSLEELRLVYSKINDLEGIGSLTNLKKIDLYKTEVKNMEAVKSLQSLEEIREK